MSQIPDDVIVTELPDGVHYRFPLRRRGPFVWAGLMHLTGGIVGIAFMTFWTGAVSVHINWHAPLQGPEGLMLLFFAGGCFMLGLTLWLAAQGVTRLVGHSEIELRGDKLRGYECWGPLRWHWGRPVAGIVRFDVRDANLEKGSIQSYDTPDAALRYNVITPLWESDGDTPPEERKRLGWGYPRDWLMPIAAALSRRCRLAVQEPSALVMAASAAPIPVAADPLPNAAGFVEHVEQPANSKFQVETSAGALRLRCPRTFTLEIEGDELRVWQKRMFGGRNYAWSREQIAEVRVGKMVEHEGPDTAVADSSHPGEGEVLGLPVAEADARWLATLLRDTRAPRRRRLAGTGQPILRA